MPETNFDEFSLKLNRLRDAFLARITLKSLKHAPFLSEETQAFTATVFWDGKRIGTSKNDGHGGCTDIYPRTDTERARLKAAADEIKAHADAGDYSDLDYIVDCAVERDLVAREDKKAIRGGKIAWVTAEAPNQITSVKWPALAARWPESKPEFMVEAKAQDWISDPSTVTFINDKLGAVTS